MKIMLEEERWERLEEITQLEETVVKLKAENEKERVKALELEAELKKRKHRVEKQRKLTESRSSYRLCLERVLRDTMHQYETQTICSESRPREIRIETSNEMRRIGVVACAILHGFM